MNLREFFGAAHLGIGSGITVLGISALLLARCTAQIYDTCTRYNDALVFGIIFTIWGVLQAVFGYSYLRRKSN